MKARNFEQQIPRFWKKVLRNDKDQCWPWLGARHKEGYGRWRYDGKFISAHRFSYMVHFGPIPDKLLVCHKCDNPPCCNPDHFFLGTKMDNAHDRDKKGRNVVQHGEDNLRSILTKDEVISIRKEFTPRHVTLQMLANKYHVSKSAIKMITTRRNWKHL